MRLPAEKRVDPKMRFFTPERFRAFNSDEDGIADRADEDWEGAIRDYRAHLAAIEDRLPPSARRLATLSLHDAHLLAIDEQIEAGSPLDLGLVGLFLGRGEEVVSLNYATRRGVGSTAPTEPWPFSGRMVHWLYDEIDLSTTDPGDFIHRILWSDGRVVEIPFLDCWIRGFRPIGDESRRSA